MTDQNPAQTGVLNSPVTQGPSQQYTLCYKLAWRWRLACLWARFLVTGSRLGVPELVNFIGNNRAFLAFQVPSELTALGETLVQLHPECALEIGTALGGTLLFLTRLASAQATIVSVDLPGGRFGGGYSNTRRWFYQRFARRHQRLHLLQGDSHSTEMLERLKVVIKNRALDYLFIDGDHRYEGVKRDFEMYAPMVKKGGLIAFHDVVEGKSDLVGGVPQFWREVKSRYRHAEFIENPNQGGYGIGLLYVE